MNISGDKNVNKASLSFANPDRFSMLDAASVGRMISTASDVSFVVSRDGQIHDISIGDEIFGPEILEHWSGAALQDLVTEESRAKIITLLEDAARGETPHWREVNHLMPNGEEFPVRYSAVASGPSMIIVLGRDLRSVSRLQNRLVKAQLALEQDYERFRQIETRYRVLFETSSEALLIMDAESGRIIEANPTAARLLGRPVRALVNTFFESEFEAQSHHEITATLASVRATGKAADLQIRSHDGNSIFDVNCVLFRAATETFILCRLTRLNQDVAHSAFSSDRSLEALFARTSDAVVMTNAAGLIQEANEAFLALAGVAVADRLRGTSLAEFLGRPGVDLTVMMSNAQEHGRLSIYATTLRSAYGSTLPVEISAVHLSAGGTSGYGFILRDVSRLEASRERAQTVSPEAVEHVLELVGSAPLKTLVRSTTDVVERMCIEAALQLTQNNRAAAAEMLGLSRQSLYVKLRKFDMISASDAED